MFAYTYGSGGFQNTIFVKQSTALEAIFWNKFYENQISSNNMGKTYKCKFNLFHIQLRGVICLLNHIIILFWFTSLLIKARVTIGIIMNSN